MAQPDAASGRLQGEGGKPLDRETALARIKEHIDAVVGRYKGRINGWDVVNEAIDDDGKLRSGPVGPPGQRGEPWHAAIGDDYIEQAFRLRPRRRSRRRAVLQRLQRVASGEDRGDLEAGHGRCKAKGVRIDGLGLQGHWGMDYPKLEEIDHMLTEYGKLGVKLMITELDINVLPQPGQQHGRRHHAQRRAAQASSTRTPTACPTISSRRWPSATPRSSASSCKHRDKIDRVTFWGVHDGQSWLNDWPVRGRTTYPLLFDRQLQPKPAFEAVVEVGE